MSNEIKIITLNIQNPSEKRAYEQLKWIVNQQANILILTEAKFSSGGFLIKKYLISNGYKVMTSVEESKEYVTIIAVKGFPTIEWDFSLTLLPNRMTVTKIQTPIGVLNIIGLYVPSHNNFEPIKNERKEDFQKKFIDTLTSEYHNKDIENLLIGGDLNVLEPGHQPMIPHFRQWEYFYDFFKNFGLLDAFRFVNPHKIEHSWFGKTMYQRLDHFFVSNDLIPYIKNCLYCHEPRLTKLSDHSALVLSLKI